MDTKYIELLFRTPFQGVLSWLEGIMQAYVCVEAEQKKKKKVFQSDPSQLSPRKVSSKAVGSYLAMLLRGEADSILRQLCKQSQQCQSYEACVEVSKFLVCRRIVSQGGKQVMEGLKKGERIEGDSTWGTD